MTDNNHPINPPPKLVQQWMQEASGQPPGPDARVIATLAARWGADQQLKLDIEQVNQAWQRGADHDLEACCQALFDRYDIPSCISPKFAEEMRDWLRTARRPKPLSLKQQALTQLDSLHADLKMHGLGTNIDAIRRALEQLND